MAPPKNPNKHQKPDTQKVVPLMGRKVRYMGLGVEMQCPVCGHRRRNGMVSELTSPNGPILFCSETCVVKWNAEH